MRRSTGEKKRCVLLFLTSLIAPFVVIHLFYAYPFFYPPLLFRYSSAFPQHIEPVRRVPVPIHPVLSIYFTSTYN